MLRASRLLPAAWPAACQPAVQLLQMFCTQPHSTPKHAPSASKPTSPVLRPLEVTVPASIEALIPPLEQRQAGQDSWRTGLMAVKVGMLSEWDEYGVLTPLTVLWFDDNQVWPSIWHVKWHGVGMPETQRRRRLGLAGLPMPSL